MGSSSRQAIARARGVLNDASLDAQSADELLAVARLIAKNSQLLSALSEAETDTGATEKLVTRVFGGSVSASVLAIVTRVATSRWSDQHELVEGIEELGIRAAARSGAESLPAELLAFSRVVASDSELELALGNKLGDATAKASVVGRLLEDRVTPEAITIAKHLVQSPRGRRLGAMFSTAADLIADERGRRIAKVIVANQLSQEQASILSTRLGTMYKTDVDLDVVEDPAIIGGVRVEIGHDVIDGSVKARLTELQQKLAG